MKLLTEIDMLLLKVWASERNIGHFTHNESWVLAFKGLRPYYRWVNVDSVYGVPYTKIIPAPNSNYIKAGLPTFNRIKYYAYLVPAIVKYLISGRPPLGYSLYISGTLKERFINREITPPSTIEED